MPIILPSEELETPTEFLGFFLLLFFCLQLIDHDQEGNKQSRTPKQHKVFGDT